MRTGWLTVLSLAVAAAAMAAGVLLVGVPAARNHPEGYVAAFAVAATLAALAVALGRRWHAWTALALTLVLFAGSGVLNFGVMRIPDAPTALRIGERPPDFTLPDAGGRPVSLAAYRGARPVILVFYRGSW
jgi:hypothetical protein